MSVRNFGREIFWSCLVTKSQLQGIIQAMDLDVKAPPKGRMQVIAFPDGDLVQRIEWTKAVSEYGDRLYRIELERNILPNTSQV